MTHTAATWPIDREGVRDLIARRPELAPIVHPAVAHVLARDTDNTVGTP